MILVVDDHADTRIVLVKLLKHDGYAAVGVDCGQAALDFFKEAIPCLVLLDYTMPDMNGLEVFAEMKKDPRLAAIPTIMFSAYGDLVRQAALDAGVSAFVCKGSLDWVSIHAEILRFAVPRRLCEDAPPPQQPEPPLAGVG
jgi:CheY-like chemotaxis protein